MISFWALGAAVNFVTCFLLGTLVYIRNRRDPRNVTYGFFTLSLTVWSFCYFFWQTSGHYSGALFWSRALMATAVFIPITHLHHVWIFLGQSKAKTNRIIPGFYLIGIFSALLCLTPWAVTDVRPRLMFPFWPTAGTLFYPVIFVWFMFMVLAFREMIRHVRESSDPVHRRQASYLLLANIIGWGGGITNFPLWFDIPILPVGNIFISLYALIIFYAIIRFHLMDIRVVISSAGIFIAVYSLAFGIPILLYWKDRHFLSLISVIFFSMPAPFIYNYLKKHAEDAIFVNEKKYQELLLQSTRILSRLKTTEEITHFITDTIFRIVQPKNIALYLFQGDRFSLVNKAGAANDYLQEIDPDSPIISYCRRFGTNLIDALKHMGFLQDFSCLSSNPGQNCPAAIIIPIKRHENVNGFILLGVKEDGLVYSAKDLAVLTSMADSIVINLENAKYRKEDDERRKREDALARREFLDQIVSVMSHEINNPNQAVIMGLGTIQSCARLYQENNEPKLIEAIITLSEETERTACSISTLIDNIRDFSQEHTINLKPVSVYEALPVLDVIGKSIFKKYPETNFSREIAPDLPLVLADKVPVEEILLNFLSNACHAVRGNAHGERNIILRVGAIPEKKVRLEFIDNGHGIPRHVLKNLFQIPTTTKSSSEGTGLGVWRIRRICDAIGAGYGAHSDGIGQGARFWVDLQIA